MSESLLVVGSGGRESSLGYTLGKSVDKVLYAPGNAGTGVHGQNFPIEIKNYDDPTELIANLELLAKLAEDENAFTVVGPDLALALGVVDYFNERGLPVFGPTRAAALLEWSKVYAALFNRRNGIP